ncbi:MAG TPA: hypothetical protein VGG20_01770, partial [Thermoanaerobaculia bacterium]
NASALAIIFLESSFLACLSGISKLPAVTTIEIIVIVIPRTASELSRHARFAFCLAIGLMGDSWEAVFDLGLFCLGDLRHRFMLAIPGCYILSGG